MTFRPTRRDVFRYGSASALAALPAPAIAQAWPSKPIKIICTYPPGGLTDVFSRAYGDFIAQKTGQSVVVENKTGAAGYPLMLSLVRVPVAARVHYTCQEHPG